MEDYIISPPQCRIQQDLQGCPPKPRAGCCASCQSVVCMEGLASPNGEAEQRAVPVQNPGHGAPNSCHQLPKVGQCQAFLRGAQWKDNGSYLKLQRKFWLDTGTKMFAVRLIKHWKSLPRKVVESQLLQILVGLMTSSSLFWHTLSCVSVSPYPVSGVLTEKCS